MDIGADVSVLLIDADQHNLRTLKSILESSCQVLTASSGSAALMLIEEKMPDLIVMDLLMPGMDGFEVLEELKKFPNTSNIPVILLTGMDNVLIEEKAFSLGAVDYITKPYHASIVKARVLVHLRIIRQMRTVENFGLIDALTEVPNRRSFDNRINLEWGRAVREKTSLSLLMIDVDKFKLYNDTFGHTQGDKVLKMIANITVSTLKRTTDMVFRWGGEEFAVILPNTDLEGAVMVAEAIRVNVQAAPVPAPDDNDAVMDSITVSVGVYSAVPGLESTIFDYITGADRALYVAKQTGRNKVCY